MSACRSCGAPVLWARTRAGKAMPLDAAPTADGNVALLGTNGCEVLAGQSLAAARAEHRELYLTHYATCPQADAWRKGR